MSTTGIASGEPPPDNNISDNGTFLIESLSKPKVPNIHPADIRIVLSVSKAKSAPVFNGDDTIVVKGKQYKACACNVQYNITKHQQAKSASLVDRGANGGLAGSDVKILDVC